MLKKFDECVKQYGDKIAVDCQGNILTYRELQKRINQLANYLVCNGAENGTQIGLYLERGLDALVGLLAILKVGATYIPLDPAYPQDRLEWMLSETQPSLILSQSNIIAQLPSTSAKVVCLDTEQDSIQSSSIQLDSQSGLSDTLAYIMFTSGSTGKPKGVMMPRSSVQLYLNAIAHVLAIQPEDNYLHTASFSFSSSVRQLLVPLGQGATVFLATKEQAKNPLTLLQLIKDKNVTVSDTVASVWRALLQAVKFLESDKREDLLTNSLRKILLSGELTSCAVLQQIRQSLTSHPSVVNIYGQTETVGVCAYKVPDSFDKTEGYVPVGFPYDHNRIYVLNEQGQPVKQGEIGELHVSGGCLSKGYLNRSDLTAERFLVNPWKDNEPNSLFTRLYKTGDLARQLPDGALEIKGRTDFQVKIRGMRVELGEIENALEQCQVAKEAIVVAKDDRQGNKQLIAYVVPQPGSSEISLREFSNLLRHELKQGLPDYLVPALVIKLDTIPRTPNGKRDRLSLPEPDWSILGTGTTDSKTNDEVESALLKLWTALFEFKPGLQDNFFEIGGTSLKAVELFAQIDSHWGMQLAFNHLLDNPTIETLSSYIRTGQKHDKSVIVMPLQKGETTTPPLFCIHGIGGGALYYRTMLQYLPETQPVYGIQARGFDGIEDPLYTIEEMAELYLREIRQVYPQGPLYLMGHSFGGLVAYEMAQQLQHQGEKPGLLVILDTKTPELTKYNPSILQIIKALSWNIWHTPASQRMEYLMIGTQWFFKKRKAANNKEYAEELKKKNPNMRMYNVLQPNYKAQATYEPSVYNGDMVLFRAKIQSPKSAHSSTLGWNKLVKGQIYSHTIPGQHLSIIEDPYVENLVKLLNQYLKPINKNVERQPITV